MRKKSVRLASKRSFIYKSQDARNVEDLFDMKNRSIAMNVRRDDFIMSREKQSGFIKIR